MKRILLVEAFCTGTVKVLALIIFTETLAVEPAVSPSLRGPLTVMTFLSDVVVKCDRM